MPAVGISIAVATLVGKSLGEKDIDKASEIGTTASFLGILWGVLVGFMFVILPLPLLYTFTTNEAVITLGIPVMIFTAFNQPGLNYMIVMGGALRGAGDTYNLMIYTMIRLWGLFVPFSYLFILTLNQGVVGLWQAEIFSILATAIIISKRFKSKKWAILNLN
jgi:Na+-driven multidrug efflux pump